MIFKYNLFWIFFTRYTLNIFQLPSFDATCSILSTVVSRSRKINSMHNSNNNINQVVVPGIGFAMQLLSGDIRVDYKDGSALIVSYLIHFYLTHLLFKTASLISSDEKLVHNNNLSKLSLSLFFIEILLFILGKSTKP